MNPDPKSILGELLGGGSMTEDASRAAFESILTGGWDDAQIGALLSLIAGRGPTVDELVGGARAMRAHVTRVAPSPDGPPVIDTCGTGGAPKTFNVSTAAAIVAAAAAPGRVRVAKHGSRSRTGRGSAEVIEALGVNVNATPDVQSRCLDEIGVCFSFAINHHPAMKHAAGPRKSLGFPTIFNLLGPLTNPAGADRQLLGVYNDELARKMAETLSRLGARRAMVVTSRDGLDELTVTAAAIVYTVGGGGAGGRIEAGEVDPAVLGLPRRRVDELTARDMEGALAMMRAAISGEEGGPADMTALNAAAALVVADAVGGFEEGLAAAFDAMRSGRASRVLDELGRLSHAT